MYYSYPDCFNSLNACGFNYMGSGTTLLLTMTLTGSANPVTKPTPKASWQLCSTQASKKNISLSASTGSRMVLPVDKALMGSSPGAGQG